MFIEEAGHINNDNDNKSDYLKLFKEYNDIILFFASVHPDIMVVRKYFPLTSSEVLEKINKVFPKPRPLPERIHQISKIIKIYSYDESAYEQLKIINPEVEEFRISLVKSAIMNLKNRQI